MSVRTVNAETSSMWNSKKFFPTRPYAIRCINEEVKKSEAGNNMVVLEWEIIDQEPIQVGDETLEFDGVSFTTYHVTKVASSDDNSPEEASRKSDTVFKMYQDKFLRHVHPNVVTEGWDDENPPPMKKACLFVSLYGTKKPTYLSPTPEQTKKGQKVGDIMKDPVTQKDVISYQINIGDVFGVYDKTPARPF